MYICKYCGKEFDSGQKLGGHIRRCGLNPNYEKIVNNWKQSFIGSIHEYNEGFNYFNEEQILYCQYCGKECKSLNSLCNHERLCKENPNKQESSFVKYNKNKTEYSNQYIKAKELGLSKPQISENGRKNISKIWKGKHLTEEMKLKNRLSTIKYIEFCKGECKPRYNKNACKFIDKLNEQNNWNLQHAENGGEYKLLGYWLDGYDKDLNIVFEYDEIRHYKDPINNILNDRDIQRQNNIIQKLNCEFWRYNEYLDLLYKVN